MYTLVSLVTGCVPSACYQCMMVMVRGGSQSMMGQEVVSHVRCACTDVYVNVCFISIFRNLFQQQKLLSVRLEESLPLGRQFVEDLIESLETKEKLGYGGAEPHVQGAGPIQDIDSNSVFPVLAFIATGLVLLFLLNQYYRGRSKPRRKKPRLKKYHTMLYGTKGPSV